MEVESLGFGSLGGTFYEWASVALGRETQQ